MQHKTFWRFSCDRSILVMLMGFTVGSNTPALPFPQLRNTVLVNKVGRGCVPEVPAKLIFKECSHSSEFHQQIYRMVIRAPWGRQPVPFQWFVLLRVTDGNASYSHRVDRILAHYSDTLALIKKDSSANSKHSCMSWILFIGRQNPIIVLCVWAKNMTWPQCNSRKRKWVFILLTVKYIWKNKRH